MNFRNGNLLFVFKNLDPQTSNLLAIIQQQQKLCERERAKKHKWEKKR
jgi:hypothetical protein